MNEGIMRTLGFNREMDLVNAKLCPMCSMPVDRLPFKDALSKREAEISGMCQGCQDIFDSEGEDDE